ncbi:MAG: hypothetical protein ABIO55_08000 [Ginsengibacter sp.]
MNLKIIDFKSYYFNPKILGLFRVIYCINVMIFVGLPCFNWLGSNLNYFFSPPLVSLSYLTGGFPNRTFFVLLTLTNVILFTLMFLGIWCKWTSLLFTLVSIIGHTFWYSFGKIDHTLLWIITPAFLGLAGWGSFFTVNKREGKTVDPDTSELIMSLLALSIALSMFTSGVQKIQGGWWKWGSEAVRYNFIENYILNDKRRLLADFFFSIKSHLVWKFFDYSTLVLEIGFLFSAVNRRSFQFFLFCGVVFHIIVLLMFNIRFYSNLLVYLLFIDWPSIARTFKITYNTLSQKRYTKALYVFFFLGITLNVYWIYSIIFKEPVFFLPGIIDIIVGSTKIQVPSDFSLQLLFCLATIIVVFSLVLYLKNRSSKRSIQRV